MQLNLILINEKWVHIPYHEFILTHFCISWFQNDPAEKKPVPCSLELENSNFASITPEEDESPDLDEFR